MCRGLALLLTKGGKVLCEGIGSHSATAETSRIEDTSQKYEVIIDDSEECGYVVVCDEYFKDDEITKAGLPEVKRWVKKNELFVLRSLLNCQSFAKRKNTNNSSQKTGGDTDNSFQKTSGDTDNSFQKTSWDTYNSSQETSGNTYNSHQKTGGNTDNSFQKTSGEWYCGKIVLKKYQNTTKLIFSVKDSWSLTIVELLSWVALHPEEAKKILGKELVKT